MPALPYKPLASKSPFIILYCISLLTMLGQTGCEAEPTEFEKWKMAIEQWHDQTYKGFRGVPWGITESQAESFGLTKLDDDYYTRENENMSLGYVPLDSVRYYFDSGRFFRVKLVAAPKYMEEFYKECEKRILGFEHRKWVYHEWEKKPWHSSEEFCKGDVTAIYYPQAGGTLEITKSNRPQHTGGGF